MHLRNKIPFYLYTILWLAYLMQSIVFSDASSIAKVLLVILLSWSVWNFIFTVNHHLPKPLKVLSILLVSYVLYGLFPIIENEILRVSFDGRLVAPFSYMKSALISILPIYTYYHFTAKRMISDSDIKVLSVVFLFVIIVDFYHSEEELLVAAMEVGSNREEFTNNVGYEFLSLFPYLYFFKRKYALLFIACIIGFLLIAMKRGAIFIGMICTIWYLYNWLRYASKQTKIYALVGIAITFFCIGYFVTELYASSAYFQERVESTIEGNTSRRLKIFIQLLDVYIYQSDIFQLLFGLGANSTLKFAENYAHNDWIEMLIDQGIIGLLLLFIFYLSLFIKIQKYRNIYNVFLMLFIIMFTKTFFSMSIRHMNIYATLLLGYFLFQKHYCKIGTHKIVELSRIN